ncbi:MAG: FAD-linked oxidase C-terminal domain-containing protein [Anaerolineales bacterium]|jgi:FAD/FMN-containing dehydrogenase/Fe-S oxidoreductase|nr:FAD-linked oxidase C-terminal domain-containing protein [Anaerolineales bacterium]
MTLPTDFLSELKRHFHGEVLTDSASRILYSTDASIYQMMPLGAAVPQTQDDLICALELAAKYQIPVLARGGGSSLAGQAIGPALILDTSRYLNKIVEIDPQARTATVEPGLVLARLNAAAARHGLQYGPDPASAERATIGGVIANNATGAHSILYGMSADHIASAEVILSDGSLAAWGDVEISNFQLVNEHPQSPITNPKLPITNRQLQILRAIASLRATCADEIRAGWPKTWRNSAGYRLNYLLPWSPATPPQWGNTPYPPVTNHQLPITDLQPSTFNMATLLAGSEGTLAVIRTATVRLVPKPAATILGVLAYESVAAACDDVPRLLALRPSAVELIPQMLVRLARAVPAYSAQLAWVRGDPSALLVVEFSGETAAGLRERVQSLGRDVVIAESAVEQARVWNVRKVGLGLLDSGPGPKRPVAFIEDCAIPVENLGLFVRELDKILSAHATIGAYYAHASAGTLHVRPLLDLRTGAGVQSLRSIAEATLALTLRLGGAMSSEHGDGLVRSEFLEATYGPAVVAAMRALKRAADPHNLLNPGKILDTPPLDSHLRYGPDYRSQGWDSTLDFGAQGGLSAAIEQCNGAGVCRKQEGVMCPSFQATGIEMFSTRGRANLMRALISAKPAAPPEADLKRALDLCLACKGCKSECPSGVDLAKLKYAYLEQYYRSHARPLRDYLFGYIGPLGALVAVLRLGRPLNAVMSTRLVRKIIDPLFGINEKRPLPRFGLSRPQPIRPSAHSVAHSPQPASAQRDPAVSGASAVEGPSLIPETSIPDTSSRETVLFLPDAFTRHFEPEIEQAALFLLAAAGIDWIEIPLLGAGRTLISKGFLPEAQTHHLKLLDAIRRLDPGGELPILGIEPSELYTLKDELRDLVPAERRPEAIAIAARAFLVDEFLIRNSPGAHNQRVANIFSPSPERSERSRRANLEKAPTAAPETVLRLRAAASDQDLQHSNLKPSAVLLHGHCYQKAQPPAPDGFPVGQAATATFLRALGFDVEIVPSGCCGMAGAFGYEKEHYDVSMAVGELVLLPTVRAASPETQIAAPGASCRAQIADGSPRAADHPLVIAARWLEG